jgi:hypothetical protein
MKEAARQLALNISGAALVVSTLGMLGYVGWGLMNKEMALNNKDAMMLFLGVLLAKYSDLIAFFFGSSASSKKQSETIDKLAETTRTAQEMPAPVKADTTVTLEAGESATVKAEDQ